MYVYSREHCTCVYNLFYSMEKLKLLQETLLQEECVVWEEVEEKAKVLSTQLFLVWCDFAVCHPIKREITS